MKTKLIMNTSMALRRCLDAISGNLYIMRPDTPEKFQFNSTAISTPGQWTMSAHCAQQDIRVPCAGVTARTAHVDGGW